MRTGRTLALAGAATAFFASVANAQVLPPLSTPPDKEHRLPGDVRVLVRSFKFEGNTAYTAAELAKVTAGFTNREISSEELEEARRAVTVYYISHGYINSGAIIPDQDPSKGVITIRVIEGRLSSIELHGNKWLRDGYLNGQLERWSDAPLNVNELKDGLQLLRQNPNIRQINAELKPGAKPGESILDARVLDQQPFRVGFQVDNQRPPSVGAEQIWLLASDLNLTGHSDPLELRYGIANSGAKDGGWEFSEWDNIEGSYLLPLNRFQTSLGVYGSKLNTSLIEEPFPALLIDSETIGYGVSLRQPVFQTANREAAVSIAFDRRRNHTTLLGEPFNISPGAVDGTMVASVLRVSQEWIDRGQNHVLAIRSTFNIGLDVLDSTDNRVAGDPNGTFFSWLGQAQYLRRLFNTQNQLVLRLTGQWTDEPLFALEQLSVGGMETVRGYRENQLVRDRGVVSSIEFRVPVLFDKTGAGIVYLAPFFDFGGGWNEVDSPSPTTIYSTGIGILINPNRHINAQLYWGHRLRDVDTPDDKDPQDLGLHFRVNLDVF
jgi:hemolysin activation/secretion protein